MRTYSLVALLLVILALAGVQSLPTCSTTTCSTSADCPRHTDNLAPVCSRGRCTTGPPVVKIHIGDNCDIYSPISQCDEGLVCSSAGLADGQAVCQYPIPYGCNCETDDQCDGGRCKAGHCDPIHSIGDLCTEDDQCGSVCVKGICAAGPVGAKCNKHISCVSGFCADNSTCQTNPKGLCGAANPYGACADAGAFCYDGTCYTSNGGIGAVCNSSVPAPMCKDTLGCVDGKCQIIPEGQSCSSRRSCSALQDCVCGENGQYGCYTLVGLSCTSAYQDYLDCINSCSEPLSESMPDSCAHECRKLKSKYSCCIGCASDSTLYNVKGNCPDTAPQLCCSAIQACSTLSGDALCHVSSNDTVPSTSAPTSPPTSTPTSPPSSPPSSSPSSPPSPRPSSSPSTGETDPEQNNPSAASRFSPSVALLGVVMAVASAVL